MLPPPLILLMLKTRLQLPNFTFLNWVLYWPKRLTMFNLLNVFKNTPHQCSDLSKNDSQFANIQIYSNSMSEWLILLWGIIGSIITCWEFHHRWPLSDFLLVYFAGNSDELRRNWELEHVPPPPCAHHGPVSYTVCSIGSRPFNWLLSPWVLFTIFPRPRSKLSSEWAVCAPVIPVGDYFGCR